MAKSIADPPRERVVPPEPYKTCLRQGSSEVTWPVGWNEAVVAVVDGRQCWCKRRSRLRSNERRESGRSAPKTMDSRWPYRAPLSKPKENFGQAAAEEEDVMWLPRWLQRCSKGSRAAGTTSMSVAGRLPQSAANDGSSRC
ncbi:hypothetical protein GW17_00051351 [Ensete ventricosum]|nr:hypothetical protein GW17_00051351 [Ensete ventricosum]